MSMNLFDSPSNSQEQNEETGAPLVSSGGISSSSAERNIDFNRSSSSSSSPPSDEYEYEYNRNQDNDSSPNTTLAANDEDANYTATYTGAFPSHEHRNFLQEEDERQQEEQQQEDEKRSQFEHEEVDYNNAKSKHNFDALNQGIFTEKISHSEQYDISRTPPSSPPPASPRAVGRTANTNSSNHHSSHNRQNANENDNNRSSFQTSNQWIHHHMEEATRMTRDVEKCLEELHRIQVQNAIVMDHLVMAGADLHA